MNHFRLLLDAFRDGLISGLPKNVGFNNLDDYLDFSDFNSVLVMNEDDLLRSYVKGNYFHYALLIKNGGRKELDYNLLINSIDKLFDDLKTYVFTKKYREKRYRRVYRRLEKAYSVIKS
jgi:hypothetical protein